MYCAGGVYGLQRDLVQTKRVNTVGHVTCATIPHFEACLAARASRVSLRALVASVQARSERAFPQQSALPEGHERAMADPVLGRSKHRKPSLEPGLTNEAVKDTYGSKGTVLGADITITDRSRHAYGVQCGRCFGGTERRDARPSHAPACNF